MTRFALWCCRSEEYACWFSPENQVEFEHLYAMYVAAGSPTADCPPAVQYVDVYWYPSGGKIDFRNMLFSPFGRPRGVKVERCEFEEPQWLVETDNNRFMLLDEIARGMLELSFQTKCADVICIYLLLGLRDQALRVFKRLPRRENLHLPFNLEAGHLHSVDIRTMQAFYLKDGRLSRTPSNVMRVSSTGFMLSARRCFQPKCTVYSYQRPEDPELDLLSWNLDINFVDGTKYSRDTVCAICILPLRCIVDYPETARFLDNLQDPKFNVCRYPCRHTFHSACMLLYQRKALSPKSVRCPLCKASIRFFRGPSPSGVMRVISCRGFQSRYAVKKTDSFYSITFAFEGGTQQWYDPDPGKQYSPVIYKMYLSDTPKGRRVLALLVKAFQQGLTYTLATPKILAWDYITHKEKLSDYKVHYAHRDKLDEALAELAAYGLK